MIYLFTGDIMRKDLKQDILNTALQLFNENGYRNTSMRSISDNLGISIGNLTYHFHKKEDILIALLQIPDFTKQGPANNFEELFLQIDAMLESLIVNRFFFSDDELGRINVEFYRHNIDNVDIIGQLLKTSILNLAKTKWLKEWRNKEECNAFCQMIMYSHITWIKDTIFKKESCQSKQEFLFTHWHLLYCRVSDDKLEEYQKAYALILTL